MLDALDNCDGKEQQMWQCGHQHDDGRKIWFMTRSRRWFESRPPAARIARATTAEMEMEVGEEKELFISS